ncbi:MAG: tripartite tricarboxylate transporter TctB family protein [Deltaproteobacteria bacterium]
MEQEQAGGRTHSGLSYNTVEMVTSVVAFLIGVLIMFDSYRIGWGWAIEGPQAGYFPFRIGAIMCIASLVVFLRPVFAKKQDAKVFVNWEQFKLVLAVFVPTVIYVLVTQVIGIYVASTLFIGGFMRTMEKSSWLKTVMVSVGVSAVLFWMFEIQFLVPLPKGPLESLFGY